MRLIDVVTFLLLTPSLCAAQFTECLVSSRLANQVLRFDGATGEFLGRFDGPGSGLQTPNGVLLGADGFVYVASRDGAQILRFHFDGTFDRVFASGPEMLGPSGIIFGPGGDLYVANSLANNVSQYDRHTGALVKTFGTGGELSNPISLAFGPDGDLYVTSATNNRLVRYNGASGALVGVVAEGGVLANPTDVKLGPDGLLYISSVLQNRIARYDVTSGLIESYAQSNFFLPRPTGLAFGPGGNLFVDCFTADKVTRVIDPATMEDFIAPGAGGLDGPQYLTFVPEPGFGAMFISMAVLFRARRALRYPLPPGEG
jgi:DNA-binding beta-propeller fold protein YncE